MMKCYCKQSPDGFYYVVEDAPESTHDLIQAAFFKRHGDTFLKWYPVDMPDKEIVIPNYERLAQGLFSRNTVNWENALNTFCTIAKRNSIDFIIRGSVSACLYGVNITPTDIDIYVDVNDIEKLKGAFNEYIIEPLVYNDSLMMVKYFGRLCIDSVWIDVSAFSKKGYEVKNVDVKCWNGNIVLVQSLKECYEVYRAMGKDKYIMEIEECLQHL